MVNKIVLSAVAVFLVVGVVIGAVVVVNKTNAGKEPNGGNKDLSSSNKMVDSICQVADDKKLCTNTLDKAGNSTDPKDFYKVAIEATIKAINNSIGLPGVLIKKVDPKNTTENSRVRMGVDDCKDLLELAIQDLQASFSTVGDANMVSFRDHIHNIHTWLSGVATYQTTCTDQLKEAPEIQKEMGDGILDARKLTDNAVAIFAKFDQILGSLGFELSASPRSRKLLNEDGTPSWMPAADRKLLANEVAPPPKPNVVVAQDGSGQFKTISEALLSYPKKLAGRYVIYVKAGVYREYPLVQKYMTNVLMYGDGPDKTIVTGDKSGAKGVNTMNTATFAVTGEGFIAKSMGFQNTAGPEGHQAVALRVTADKAVFHLCRIEGYQDTLYIHAFRQFYRDCVISGTVDFIFGNAQAVIQNSKIIVRKPGPGQKNMITAHGKDGLNYNTGIVIHNCDIVPEDKLVAERTIFPTFLGRPWKPFSTAIFMESNLGDFIKPEGWHPWDGSPQHGDSCFFAEYNNAGPAANTAQRAPWKGVHRQLSKQDALRYTTENYLFAREFIAPAGVPYVPSFVR